MPLRELTGSTAVRFGALVAVALAAQAALVSVLFWWQTAEQAQRRLHRELASDCARLASMVPERRDDALQDRINGDLHRIWFVGLFTASGQPIFGNVAAFPSELPVDDEPRPIVLQRALPSGRTPDATQAVACRTPGGERLVLGQDLDNLQGLQSLVAEALMFGAIPAAMFAIAGGMLLGRRNHLRLARFRAAMDRVIDGHLSERLPVRAGSDEFDLLAGNVNRMLARIETLVNEVRGLGDDIAHELRTPLTRLRARLERYSAEPATSTQTIGQDAVGEIDQALQIIEALLRIREIEQERRRAYFSQVLLEPIVQTAVELYRPVALGSDVDLCFDASSVPAVLGDANLLMEAAANLLDNAIKFTPPGGRVDVCLTGDGRDAARIVVADTGPGIPAAERSNVLRRFYRAPQTQAPGHGLGLSLVAAIADVHGFTLTIHPVELGTRISLLCPYVDRRARHGGLPADVLGSEAHGRPTTLSSPPAAAG